MLRSESASTQRKPSTIYPHVSNYFHLVQLTLKPPDGRVNWLCSTTIDAMAIDHQSASWIRFAILEVAIVGSAVFGSRRLKKRLDTLEQSLNQSLDRLESIVSSRLESYRRP